MRTTHPFVVATPFIDNCIRVFRRMILRVDGSNYRGVWPVTRELTSCWFRENFGEHARESFEIRYFELRLLSVNTYGPVELRSLKAFVQRKREKCIELIWTQFRDFKGACLHASNGCWMMLFLRYCTLYDSKLREWHHSLLITEHFIHKLATWWSKKKYHKTECNIKAKELYRLWRRKENCSPSK
jgi:hypothetical protein